METITPEAEQVLKDLLEGNRRFREGRPKHLSYSISELRQLSEAQHPKVGIVACSDSRVSPDIIFDQPLGNIFSSRVPGNVASDSAKWMLELAIGEFKVPLVMIVGHSGCLAVGSLLDGDKGGAGGTHRWTVSNAVYRAKMRRTGDLYTAAIEENVSQTVEHLVRDLRIVRTAILEGRLSIVGAVYDMPTGAVRIIETKSEMYGTF